MVLHENEKYLQNLSLPRAEFFDLERDPGETRSGTRESMEGSMLTTALLGWLRQQWNTFRELPSTGSEVPVDADNIEKLKALGYLD